MINRAHRWSHNPRRGWDPIPAEYAEQYAREVARVDPDTLTRVETALGEFGGRRVADVGSGPGQYGIAFAERGALVTCVDVSRRYLEIARNGFDRAGLSGEFVLAYMEDIGKIAPETFDFVFNNVCWYYCAQDYEFARSLLCATKAGGLLFIRVANAESHKNPQIIRRLQYWLYRKIGWKIGHLLPPRGRVEQAFRRTRSCNVIVDYSDPDVDVVIIRKDADTSHRAEEQTAAMKGREDVWERDT